MVEQSNNLHLADVASPADGSPPNDAPPPAETPPSAGTPYPADASTPADVKPSVDIRPTPDAPPPADDPSPTGGLPPADAQPAANASPPAEIPPPAEAPYSSDAPPPADTSTSAGDPLPPAEPMPVPVVAPRFNKPLQGSVEQTGLQGGAQGSGLQGGAQGSGLQGGAQGNGLSGGVENGGWVGDPQQGRIDQSRPSPLQGGAAQNPMALNAMNDPDAGSQELQIDWDLWRNTLMQAIQSGTLAKINVQNEINFVWDPRSQMMVSRYPNGTSTWYALQVLPDRRIINIRLTQPSRYPSYDQAVLQAINDLQGNSILTYPRGSKRQIVSQESNVRTASQSQSQNFQFGDVETQRY